MEKFSQMFTFEELTDSSSFPKLVTKNRKESLEFTTSGVKLSFLLESIRRVLGNKPIVVTSGFRGASLNKAVGSTASKSKHTLFEAADIQHTSLSPKVCFKMLMAVKEELPELRKVILEEINGRAWLHIEVKTSSTDVLSFWKTTDGRSYTKVEV